MRFPKITTLVLKRFNLDNNVSFLSKPINKESKESLTETKILISQKLIDYKENYPLSNYFSYQL